MTDAFIPSDVRVLNALKVLLPVGTMIDPANVYIEKSISVQAGGFPALILSIPDDERTRQTMGEGGAVGWEHQVMAVYLDLWNSSARTYGQLMADARRALNQMVANYSENTSLVATYTLEPDDGGSTVTHAPNALELRQRIRRHIDVPVDNRDYGFPLLSAWLRFTIQGLWERWTPTS